MSKLSRVQFNRFCYLLTVHTGKVPNDHVKELLKSEGYINPDKELELNTNGINELIRLSTLAGLLSDSVFNDINIKKEFDKTSNR